MWDEGFTYFSIAIIVAIAIPDASSQVRRLHDTNTSGLWLLPIYFFIPAIFVTFFSLSGGVGLNLTMAQQQGLLILGAVWIILLLGVFTICFLPGTKGDNKYGEDPLGRYGEDSLGHIVSKARIGQSLPEHNESASKSLSVDAYDKEARGLRQNAADNEGGLRKSFEDSLSDEAVDTINNLQEPENADHPLEEAFSILLEHDEAVRVMIDSVSGVPRNVRQDILNEVLKMPGEDLKNIRDTAILKALGRPDMKWNEELDVVVQTFKNADRESVEKFFKAFPVLSHRMSIREIRNKVIVFKESIFYVQTAGGRDVQVTHYGDDIFEFSSLTSGKVTLNSLNEVFEYLRTPEKLRYKKQSW